MKIYRTVNGKRMEFELTYEEIAKASEEFVVAFMKDVLIAEFKCGDDEAEGLAAMAYKLYCKGNGLTEYKCIQEVYDQEMVA